jgi:hypothetical protein
MIKHIYILLVIFSISTSFYGCEDFNIKPRQVNNLTYRIIGNSLTSNEEGIFITKLDSSYVLGGMTDVALDKDYLLVKTDKNGQVEFNFKAGFSLKDDALLQVVVTNSPSLELFALLNQESTESLEMIPVLTKVIYDESDSTNTVIDKSIALERGSTIVGERENSVEMVYLESSNQFLVLSNIIEKDTGRVRLTLVDELSGIQVWSRVYSFNTGAANLPKLEGVGLIQETSGNFIIMGNMSTDINGVINVKVFSLEVDNLGNEVAFNFPIENEALLGFTKMNIGEYALMTTKVNDNGTSTYKDLKLYEYESSSGSTTLEKTLDIAGTEDDDKIIGKSIQKIKSKVIVTAIEKKGERNTAVIYQLSSNLSPNLIEEWREEYYYSTGTNTLNIGNVIERIGGGYAVIGTHDLGSSTKMVLLLLDEDGRYIDN